MRCRRRIEVLKRDGSVEPLSLGKLARTIGLGLIAEGVSDRQLSWRLAEAVLLYLQTRSRQGWPTSGCLTELVEAVLRETGNPAAAEAVRRADQQRRRRRRRTQVCQPDGSLIEWDKGRLVDWLVRHKQLERAAARQVAADVERRALGGETGPIARRQLAEWVAAELSAWGLSDKALTTRAGRS